MKFFNPPNYFLNDIERFATNFTIVHQSRYSTPFTLFVAQQQIAAPNGRTGQKKKIFPPVMRCVPICVIRGNSPQPT